MASRGLHSFDYARTGRRPTSYYLVAKPAVPLRLDDLPQEISEILQRTTLRNVLFDRDELIGADIVQTV
jgi:hypothetical protein